MKGVSSILAELLEGNELLQLGLANRLLNLSQVARFLRPQLEARAKRNLEVSAITMALSRLQREIEPAQHQARIFPSIANMIVHSQLLICIYPMSRDVRAALNTLYMRVQKNSGYITISEGITEVSLITGMSFAQDIKELLPGETVYRHENVSSIAVKFHPTFFETVGVFHSMVQQLYFQNINIVEIASAGTEVILYLAEQDVRLAFDTLYRAMNAPLVSK